MWTIYDHPKDYPIGFIARMWMMVDGRQLWTDRTLTSPHLEEVRFRLRSKGLSPVARDPRDDPKIVETWL